MSYINYVSKIHIKGNHMNKPLRQLIDLHDSDTIETQVFYLQSIQKDNPKRHQQYIQENILNALDKHIRSLIKRYVWHVEFEDALSEARMTVLECIESYEPSHNTSFKTYALKNIQYMLYDLNQQEEFEFQVPKYLAKAYYSYQKDLTKPKTALESKHIQTYKTLKGHKKKYVDDITQSMIPSPYETPEQLYLKDLESMYLNEALETLDEREKDVIYQLYLDQTSTKTLSSISREYQVSNPMMTKIHQKALQKLKTYMEQTPLKKIKYWLNKM